MSKAFVILAAGRGTRMGRVGDSLHKALAPLGRKAVLSHILALRPPIDIKTIIVVGHRASQIKEYMRLAHPSEDITYVYEPDFAARGSGPGTSLLRAEEAIGDRDAMITMADALWEWNDASWDATVSWVGIAPPPPGTDMTRWCLIHSTTGGIVDKPVVPPTGEGWAVYAGPLYVRRCDLPAFWDGLRTGVLVDSERQVSAGMGAIDLTPHEVHWTDVGDEESYHQAILRTTGYDFIKPNEATYVIPEERRVVKFWANGRGLQQRVDLAAALAPAVPQLIDGGREMLSYRYEPGISAYEWLEADPTRINHIIAWANQLIWQRELSWDYANEFYRLKTLDRIEHLRSNGLRQLALTAYDRVDWGRLYKGTIPSRIHGDLTFANIIVSRDDTLHGIDWGTSATPPLVGDARYDLAKLLVSTVVNWDAAQRGDFRPWDKGPEIAALIQQTPMWTSTIPIIAALSLLNSAPLHAPPLDEVLVARGAAWLTEVT